MVSPSSSSRPDPSSLVSPRTDTLISAARVATDPGAGAGAGARFRGWVSRLMGGGGGGSEGRSTDLPPDLPGDGQLMCGDNTELGVTWSHSTSSIYHLIAASVSRELMWSLMARCWREGRRAAMSSKIGITGVRNPSLCQIHLYHSAHCQTARIARTEKNKMELDIYA